MPGEVCDILVVNKPLKQTIITVSFRQQTCDVPLAAKYIRYYPIVIARILKNRTHGYTLTPKQSGIENG